MEWVSRIYRAMSEEQFCLYAQAIKCLDPKVGAGRHYELLLRIKDDNGTMIAPGAFLPAAERYNLIGELDRWVVSEAVRLLEVHPDFMDSVDFVSIIIGPDTER
jgi:FOG: EAL domain